MIYYILGILVIIAVHLISFLKLYERKIKVNRQHMLMSVLFSMYMVFVLNTLRGNMMEGIPGIFKIILMSVPLGIFMPLIYRRFRYFVVNMLYILVLSIFILILQMIQIGQFNPLCIIFSMFGVMVGFTVSMIINACVPNLRKSLIMKKRKKDIKFISFEGEIVSICLVILFFGIAVVEKAYGSDLNSTLKGVVKYNEKDEKNETDEKGDVYASIYYAESNKYDRYNAYAAKHPEYSVEDVVWRVNANLDQEFYDSAYVNFADDGTDSPLLINKFNRVSKGYEPDKLVKIEGNYVATPETVEAYKAMTADMKKLGLKVYVVSSYRSVSYQDNLYKGYLKGDTQKEVDTYSARPGYSEHHTGRALDISQVQNNLNAFEGSEEAEWVYENAYKYGFIVRYKAEQMDVTGYIFEPWHITYVGTEISTTMHDENIETLEEYVVKYVDHRKP